MSDIGWDIFLGFLSRRNENALRDGEIYLRREEGETFRKLAVDFDLSPERVRVIFMVTRRLMGRFDPSFSARKLRDTVENFDKIIDAYS